MALYEIRTNTKKVLYKGEDYSIAVQSFYEFEDESKNDVDSPLFEQTIIAYKDGKKANNFAKGGTLKGKPKFKVNEIVTKGYTDNYKVTNVLSDTKGNFHYKLSHPYQEPITVKEKEISSTGGDISYNLARAKSKMDKLYALNEYARFSANADSGGELTENDEKGKIYLGEVKTFLKRHNYKKPLSMAVFKELEDSNYHVLNNALGILGYYGGDMNHQYREGHKKAPEFYLNPSLIKAEYTDLTYSEKIKRLQLLKEQMENSGKATADDLLILELKIDLLQDAKEGKYAKGGKLPYQVNLNKILLDDVSRAIELEGDALLRNIKVKRNGKMLIVRDTDRFDEVLQLLSTNLSHRWVQLKLPIYAKGGKTTDEEVLKLMIKLANHRADKSNKVYNVLQHRQDKSLEVVERTDYTKNLDRYDNWRVVYNTEVRNYAKGGSVDKHDIQMMGEAYYLKFDDGEVWLTEVVGDYDSDTQNKRFINGTGSGADQKSFNEFGEYLTKKANSGIGYTIQKFAKGGALSKEFKFDKNFVVYVPSTSDVSDKISKKELDARVKEVKEYVATEFGGYTETETEGGYRTSKGDIIEEEVVKVSVFSKNKDWKAKENKVVERVKKWANDWGQEAVGFEHEGDLYYVDPNGVKKSAGGTVKRKKDKKGKKKEEERKPINIKRGRDRSVGLRKMYGFEKGGKTKQYYEISFTFEDEAEQSIGGYASNEQEAKELAKKWVKERGYSNLMNVEAQVVEPPRDYEDDEWQLKAEQPFPYYAKGGMIEAKDNFKYTLERLNPAQKKLYKKELERVKEKGTEHLTDRDIAEYINGWYGEDVVTPYDISGKQAFDFGFKVIALEGVQKENEFWELGENYAKGGMTNEEKWHLLYDFLDQRHLEGEEEAGRIMNEDGYDVTYERLYDYTDERMVEGDEEAERVLEKVNKYGRGGYRANRPSPSVSATEFLVGTKKRGNDGNLWEIRANINGVHRWVKLSNYAKGGMAKGGMYSGIKEGKKVEVADYYIKDEVGQRAKATPTAIILSEPSDDEELVMVQYTNGSIDYVPQDVIEVLPFAKGGKLGEGYVIVDVYWGDNLEWNMDYVGYEGSFGLDKAILFYTKKDAEKYLKDERPDIKEEAKDNENYLEKYDLIQKVKVIARGYGEEDTIELMNSKLKTYISDINANKYAKGGNTPKFRVNQIPARMSGYDGTDKYWVIDAKSGDIKLKGDKRRCDALCKKLNSQDYAKGGETDKGLTGDQRDRMTDDIYMSEETMSDSMFQAIDDEVEGDWDVGLYRLSDSQLKKIHTDIKEDRASSYTEHKKGGEVDYESMSKQELVDRFMDKRSADLDKMTDKEVIDEYKEWFEVWDVFEEEDSHKSISKLKQELLEDEESWKWDYDKDELIDIQDDYDKYLAKGGLVKVREAIEYDENNFGQRKKLDLEKGSRNWRGLYLDIIPLVWSRNMQDGYEIYVSENRKHLGTINVDYNKRPTEISVYAKGGEVILDDYILTLKPDLTIPNEAPPFDNKDIVDTLPSSAPIFINEQFTSDWGTTWFIEQEQYDKLKSNKPITIEGGNASWDWKFKVTRDMVEKIEKRTMTKEGVKFAKGGSLEFDEGDVIVDNKEFKDLKFYRDRGGEEIEIVSDYDSGYAKIRYDEEMKDREYIVINDTVYYLDDLEVYAKGGGVKGVDYYDRLKLARKVRVKISELRKKKKTSTEITKALNSDPELSKLAKKVGKYPFKPI